MVAGLAGNSSDAVVMISGVCGAVASSLSKKLTARGLNHDQILFADFF
jgi:hypothetical protein